MAQITIKTQVIIDDVFGVKESFPTRTFTQTYTEQYRQTFSLADTSPVVAWDPSNATAAVTAFSVAYLESDATAGVDVEYSVDSTGTGGAFNSFRLMDNLPVMLGADDAYQSDGSTTAAFGNTLDVIDKIRLVNPTASNTSNVKLILLS